MQILRMLRKYDIAGVIFTAIVGTLLHFVYDWSNQNLLLSFFSPVNESTWEHLKLLFFPLLLYSIFEYVNIGKKYDDFWISRAIGIIGGLLFIVLFFYFYTSIVGRNYLFIDILTFLLGIIFTFIISNFIMRQIRFHSPNANLIGQIILLLLTVAFICFTISPPQIFLFRDPVSGVYGK